MVISSRVVGSFNDLLGETAGVKGRDIACKVTTTTLSVGLKRKPPIIKVQGLSVSFCVSFSSYVCVCVCVCVCVRPCVRVFFFCFYIDYT